MELLHFLVDPSNESGNSGEDIGNSTWTYPGYDPSDLSIAPFPLGSKCKVGCHRQRRQCLDGWLQSVERMLSNLMNCKLSGLLPGCEVLPHPERTRLSPLPMSSRASSIGCTLALKEMDAKTFTKAMSFFKASVVD